MLTGKKLLTLKRTIVPSKKLLTLKRTIVLSFSRSRSAGSYGCNTQVMEMVWWKDANSLVGSTYR
jgi:hypothetical protein